MDIIVIHTYAILEICPTTRISGITVFNFLGARIDTHCRQFIFHIIPNLRFHTFTWVYFNLAETARHIWPRQTGIHCCNPLAGDIITTGRLNTT